ncbi:hypothetical protein RUND412_009652 [Rhizina undulata]
MERTLITTLLERYKKQFHVSKLKNKLTNLKCKYNKYKALQDNSSFRCNLLTRAPIAPDKSTNNVKAYLEAKEFYQKLLALYKDFNELFSGMRTIGDYTITPITLLQISTKWKQNDSNNKKLLLGTSHTTKFLP